MLEKIKDENIIFIDIETVGQHPTFADLNNTEQRLWERKMQWHIEKDNTTAAEIYNRAAIWAEFGKIVCISIGYIFTKDNCKTLRIKSFYGHSEREILLGFKTMIETRFNKSQYLLCAHNGKEFDFPYISRRMLVNGIRLPKILDYAGHKPWEVRHLDTLDLWRFGDYKHYTSLELLSSIFGIDSPKEEMDGSQVHEFYWQNDNLTAIAEYCQRDVITICQLMMRYKGQPLIDSNNIEITEPFLGEEPIDDNTEKA
ncbi:MAG: 3'-5' exonuclease [Salinivirgaceae bacterium]|nr:3'-5' exonuclease [Salinivirgaceae bacterium]